MRYGYASVSAHIMYENVDKLYMVSELCLYVYNLHTQLLQVNRVKYKKCTKTRYLHTIKISVHNSTGYVHGSTKGIMYVSRE